MKFSSVVLFAGLALCASAGANAHRDSVGHGGGNTDVVVDMPPEVWTQGQNSQQNPPCQRCCTYENRSYSEGAVIKAGEIVLQCVSDKQTIGTNNLIWQRMK